MIFLTYLFLFFFLLCLAGLVIPIFPGLQLVWAGMVLYWAIATMTEKTSFTGWYFGIITLLMLAGTVVDNLIFANQLRKVSTPWYAIGIAYVAGLLGGIAFTPLVGILATPTSLFFVEWLRLKDVVAAKQAVRQWLFSVGWTFAARLGLGILMLLVWGISLVLK